MLVVSPVLRDLCGEYVTVITVQGSSGDGARGARAFSRRCMDGRERIAQVLGAVVTEARALLDAGGIPPSEMSNAMMFYVLADHLLGATLAADRPLNPAALAGGLKQLRAHCHGSLAGQRQRVETALGEAENVDWDYRTA